MVGRGVLTFVMFFMASILISGPMAGGTEGQSSDISTTSIAQTSVAVSDLSRQCPTDFHRAASCDHHAGLLPLSGNLAPSFAPRRTTNAGKGSPPTFEPPILKTPPRA